MIYCLHFGSFCLFAALVLLIIICVSVPIWEDVYFLKAHVTPSDDLTLGMWGICVDASGNTACTNHHLGYNIADALEKVAQVSVSKLGDSVIHGLTYALVLHPVAAGITFLAFLFAICNNRVSFVIGSLVAFFAFLIQLVAFCIDLGLFVTAHHRIDDALGSGTAVYGNALWMSLAVTILLLIAAFSVCFERVRTNRSRASRKNIENGAYAPPMASPTVPMSQRLRFWNRNN